MAMSCLNATPRARSTAANRDAVQSNEKPLTTATIAHTFSPDSIAAPFSKNVKSPDSRPKNGSQLSAGELRRLKSPPPLVPYWVMGVTMIMWAATMAFTIRSAITSRTNFQSFIVQFVIGCLWADGWSGLVHWGLDTWGTIDTPIFGNVIQFFRSHHEFPRDMCKVDWMRVNYQNCFVGMLSVAMTSSLWPNMPVTSAIGCFHLGLTNQYHAWSHELPADLPTIVRLAQKSWLILPREHHAYHHRGTHTTHYCITIGWLDPVFDSINFWRNAEFIISKITGAQVQHSIGV